MSQMLKSSGAIGAATLTSRILGMVREMVYASFMGDTPVAGAFKTALMIPNLFRRLLGEGALTRVLFGVTVGDAVSTMSASAVLLAAALIACISPALRAMRVDPVVGLRAE